MACETGPQGAGQPAPSTLAPPSPRIVPPAEWAAAPSALRPEEGALDAARRSRAARRRRMPMAPVARDHRLRTEGGEVGPLDLFGGRRQLVTYKVFYAPGVQNWPEGACPGCSMVADGPAHLAARDAALALISAASPERIAACQRRMGWDLPWASEVGTTVSDDFDVAEWSGTHVVLRDGDRVFRPYFLNGPPVEAVGSAWTLLEPTPWGRRQADEDSPQGWPQGEPPAWCRLHDAHGPAAGARA